MQQNDSPKHAGVCVVPFGLPSSDLKRVPFLVFSHRLYSRSPSSALLPFFGGRVPLLKWTTEKSWYPFSNLSTGGPRYFQTPPCGFWNQVQSEPWPSPSLGVGETGSWSHRARASEEFPKPEAVEVGVLSRSSSSALSHPFFGWEGFRLLK